MAAEKVQTFHGRQFQRRRAAGGAAGAGGLLGGVVWPCKRIAPTVDALAADFDGRAVIGKLNVDDNPRTPAQYSVRGIPTLLIFKGGQVVDSVVGAQVTRDQLTQLIEKHL